MEYAGIIVVRRNDTLEGSHFQQAYSILQEKGLLPGREHPGDWHGQVILSLQDYHEKVHFYEINTRDNTGSARKLWTERRKRFLRIADLAADNRNLPLVFMIIGHPQVEEIFKQCGFEEIKPKTK